MIQEHSVDLKGNAAMQKGAPDVLWFALYVFHLHGNLPLLGEVLLGELIL